MIIKGGTYARCSHCGKRYKIKNRGVKKLRHHRLYNPKCWDWTLLPPEVTTDG